MTRTTSMYKVQLTAAVAVVALAVPAAAPANVDLRSPDAVDTALRVERAQKAEQAEQALPPRTPGNVDLRSPDAVDTALRVERAQKAEQTAQALPPRTPGHVDLRSPDAQDTRFVQTAEPATIVASDGFDWGDASIGAGFGIGLLLIALSVILGVVHRRNRTAVA